MMTYMTHFKVAEEKWCPFARVSDRGFGGSYNRNDNGVEVYDLTVEKVNERKTDETDKFKKALHEIATGTGYYGEMAREYKNIARKALGMDLV